MPRSPKFGPRAGVRSMRRARRWKLGWERLEDLTLLSAYLYVDYGDNFAGGVLQGADVTVKNLFDRTVDGSNIHGPKLTDDQNNAFPDATTFSLTSFANFYAGTGSSTTEIAQMRTAINAMIERVYAPFDVTVIDLTAAGTTVGGKTVAAAASLDDVARTLAASGNGFDSYVFVAQAIIGGTTAGPTTDPTQFAQNGYGGKASGLDIGGDNNNQGTALSLLRSDYGVNKVAQTIAHEAGHLFGLAHAWRGDQGDNPDPRDSLGDYKDQLDLYHRFDTMSYLSFSGLSGFSRVPITADKVLSGGNWVANLDPAVLNTTPTPYDHFKADPHVGINSSIEYITGTGAHDIITAAKTGPTTALVTIEPFFDTTYATPINIPGQTTATYSYTIDTTKAIVIDGGSGNDRFVIDADLGASITVRGDTWTNESFGKASSLIVRGKGAATGVYTPTPHLDDSPSGGRDLRGQITIGSTVINFLEFSDASSVTISDVESFVFRTPPAPADGSGGNTLSVDSPEAGRNRVGRGGFTSGAAIVPLIFFDVANFTLDTATHNAASPDDMITIESTGLVASGLKNFTVNTGDGDDALVIVAGAGFGLPVAGGAFTYNAGAQTTVDGDNLIIHALAGAAGAFHPDGATAGSGRFLKNGATLFATGLERAVVDRFADFALVTPNDGDAMTITPNSATQNRIVGASGGVAFSALRFYDVTNFLIDSRTNNPGGLIGNQYTIDNPGGNALQARGLKNFTIRSSAGDDLLTVKAADFRLPVAGGELLFDAGTGRYPDNSSGSNLRGLISFDRIVVNADVDYRIADVGPFASDGAPAEGLLSIASSGPASGSLGAIRLISVEAATFNGGPSGNRMDGSGFSGTLVLNGGSGDDVLIGGSGHNELDAGDGDDLLIVGYDSLALSGLGSQNQTVFRGGGTNILQGGAGRNTFHVDLNGTAELRGGSGENLYVIANPASGVIDPVGGITIKGAGLPTDVLRIQGGGGGGYNQTYLLGSSPGSGNIITTNNRVFDGPTISQYIRFSGVARIEDTTNADEMMVLAESAAAPIGGVDGVDLAAGSVNPTIGGAPFGAIVFANKSNPMVQLADGQVIRPVIAVPAPAPPLVVADPPAPVVIPVPVAPAPLALPPAPLVFPAAPLVAEAPADPEPIGLTPARPGRFRPIALRPTPAPRFAFRPIAARPIPGARPVARPLPRAAAPRTTPAARPLPLTRPAAPRINPIAPRGPMALAMRA